MKKLPEEFVERLRSLGHEAYRRLPSVIEDSEPVVSIRINPRRISETPFPGAEPVAWNPDGFYLPERPQFTLDPRMHQGLYYVQDASSMAIRAAVSRAIELTVPNGPLRYLDACAAPGGKTTAAIDVLPDDAFVVANEFDPRRANILAENIAKWGTEAYVTRGDAAALRFPQGFFDIIATDVPCSGEGMMRKDDFAVEQWSPALVSECASRQYDIVDNLWKALSPGGCFIYSTCTYNIKENEEVVSHIIETLGGEPVEISFEGSIIGAMGGYCFPAYRFVPGEVRGEGLFMAMLRKPGYRESKAFRTPNIRKTDARVNLPDILSGDYALVSTEPLRAVRTIHLPYYQSIAKEIPPISAGLELGQIKGHDFIPSQQLALSPSLRRDRYPETEVDLPTALSYLRRGAIVLPNTSPHGIVLLTHGGHPLGWVKNLGKRANNLYPDSWRIRTL